MIMKMILMVMITIIVIIIIINGYDKVITLKMKMTFHNHTFIPVVKRLP